MNPILFLSLVIILSAALPWWPYSAYGRSRHHRPWDWLLDTPSSIDFKAAAEAGTRRVHQTWLDKQQADETKIIDQQHEPFDRGPIPEASLKAAMKKLEALDRGPIPKASQKAAMKKLEALDRGPTPECDSKSEMDQLFRRFEERWAAGTTNNFDDGCVAADATEPAGDNAPSSKERKVIQSGVFEGKSFSIFDDGSIEIETGSGLQQFKDFAELRAVAAARRGQ
jgi:hypothetical protein